jgi:hypothetical protein
MEATEIQTNSVKYPKGRKSLAVDKDTYDKLQAICDSERRSKIDQLKVLIESAYSDIISTREQN